MKRTSIAVLPVVVAAFLCCPPPADGSVKKIVVEKKVSPAFEGASFGAAVPSIALRRVLRQIAPRPSNSEGAVAQGCQRHSYHD